MSRVHWLRRTLLGLWFGVLALSVAAPAYAQSKEYRYDRFDVQLQLSRAGVLTVTETMTLTYVGGPFRSASRGIALQRLDAVRDIALSEGATVYSESEGSAKTPGTFVVERDSRTANVRWYYEPTSDASRTFTLRYSVDGALRLDSASAELWWIAVFPDRTVPVLQSRVTLDLPTGTQLTSADITLPAASGNVTTEGESVLVTRSEALPPGQSLDLRVRLPMSAVSASKPAWQQQAEAPTAVRTSVPFATSVPRPAAQSATRSKPIDPLACLAIPIVLIGTGFWLYKGLTTGDWGSSSSGSSDSSYHSSSSSSSSGSWGDSGSSSSSSSSSDSGGSGGGSGGAE